MEKIAKENREHQADLARQASYAAEQSAELSRRNAQILAEEQAWQMEQDREARVNEMHEQHQLESQRIRNAAELQAEASIGYDGAYRYGYEFFDKTYPKCPKTYPASLNWEMENIFFGFLQSETGEADFNPSAYKFSIKLLRDAAEDGFNARVAEQPRPSSFEYMIQQAYQKGVAGEGKFSIPSERTLFGRTLETVEFDAEFNFVLNESTGEYTLYRVLPFQSQEMNEAYDRGLGQYLYQLNTAEELEYRLQTEFPRVRAERVNAERQAAEAIRLEEKEQADLEESRRRYDKNEKKLEAEWENVIWLKRIGMIATVCAGLYGFNLIWELFEGWTWLGVTLAWPVVCLIILAMLSEMDSAENRSKHFHKIFNMN
jgi:hypothetical protein